MNDPLGAVSTWPAEATAGVLIQEQGIVSMTGPATISYPWASVTKVLTALAVWVAVEEGTVEWSDPVGPPDATLAHLLAHASGLSPDSDAMLAAPATRRIYSNRGIELAALHVAARSEMSFREYLAAGVLEPLRLDKTILTGSPASGASGPLTDLLNLGQELLVPTLVSAETMAKATSVAFVGLAGVLPGFGRQDPNDWGLGVEVRDHKRPHWTGAANSPETFGHFGRSGSFLWVDPVQHLVLASLADQPFGPWAARAWPVLSDAVIEAYGHRRSRDGGH